ncbi:MAG: 2-oxoacid:acceptor oxidoreductase family protein [Eubacterium sp.]|nr:2-oxoacid:acceptor oxidoreductase family protein [Eubacterium sp.]
MIDIRWYGRGGQGAFTAARLLGRVMSVYENRFALAYPSFGPERRGAPVWSFTRIDDTKVLDRSTPDQSDYLIILDETLIKEDTFDVLKEGGVVIINTADPDRYQDARFKVITLDATKMALETLGRPITNITMMGAFLGACDLIDVDKADQVIKDHFSKKLYEKNSKCLKLAYETVKEGM